MTETAPGTVRTIPVRDNHRFDEVSLAAYLQDNLEDFDGALEVRQFKAGQSNPTFQLLINDRKYVLRKKPPGKLLPSAHAVDREFRVINALQHTKVPVPRTLILCEDDSVIGTAFYVMEMIEGRVFHDPGMPGVTTEERQEFFDDFIHILAALHSVDIKAVGLGDFGRPEGYLERQIQRWAKQYELSKTDEIPEMSRLYAWLIDNLPDDQSASVVHGDFRPGNMIAGPAQAKISSVLDWELSTLGHPLADLGYCCAAYHGEVGSIGVFSKLDHAALGIPTEQEFVNAYCHYSGRKKIENFQYYVVHSLFRSAAIIQGVYKRGLDGNASSTEALTFGRMARERAKTAWQIVEDKLG
ncbi:MAG: phosphotransferase [Rhodospirillaceae bacterium]|nr:phosphotransferase [Rhodospirillaceae bacterium]